LIAEPVKYLKIIRELVSKNNMGIIQKKFEGKGRVKF
jgi:hypothetical protein